MFVFSRPWLIRLLPLYTGEMSFELGAIEGQTYVTQALGAVLMPMSFARGVLANNCFLLQCMKRFMLCHTCRMQ